MKCSKVLSLVCLALLPPVTIAHGGGFHLDDATIEAVFQFMDRTYQWFAGHLPLTGGIAAGLVAVVVVGRALRTRAG